MELRTSIAFIGDSKSLEIINRLINEESVIDDMVYSVDFVPELETEDTYVYRCYSTEDNWVNIYEVQKRLAEEIESQCDIIFASTDAKTFIDVISISGNFDAYIDTDTDKIQEICETYGLEFFGSDAHEDDEEEEYYDADDWN